jgi:hypothetical protein
MKARKLAGDWKQAAQALAEKAAEQRARLVWLAYWKKYDRARKLKRRAA